MNRLLRYASTCCVHPLRSSVILRGLWSCNLLHLLQTSPSLLLQVISSSLQTSLQLWQTYLLPSTFARARLTQETKPPRARCLRLRGMYSHKTGRDFPILQKVQSGVQTMSTSWLCVKEASSLLLLPLKRISLEKHLALGLKHRSLRR